MLYQHAICWLRRDLRLDDHAALSAAAAQAKTVTVVFLYDSAILAALPDKNDARLQFIFESLASIDARLRAQGGALVVVRGKAWEEIPALAKRLRADAVFCNRDYEGYAKQRDAQVAQALGNIQVAFHTFKDHVIFEGHEVVKKDHSPYQVFTPYARRWLELLNTQALAAQEVRPRCFTPPVKLKGFINDFSLASIGFEATKTPFLKGGFEAGRKAWRGYLTKHVEHYDATRNDLLGEGATSKLATHLRFGTLSLRSMVRDLQAGASGVGQQSWLRQVIWRDFYQMVLDQYPHVEEGPFRPEYNVLKWPGKRSHYEAWTQGLTGYPLIDAAMRGLRQSGWMPNRLRMVTASFFAKDLLLDYRLGEAWFARHLIDYDKAANNGGWQWCASTGCDAQPYFRVFNPLLQSRRFDPQGHFIRAHLPELARLDDKAIHWPHGLSPAKLAGSGIKLGRDYPRPLVDHASQSIKAVALFKAVASTRRYH